MNDGAQTLAAPARTLKARIERKYPAVAISPKTAHRSFRSVELKCFLKPGSTAPVHVMEFSRTRVGHRRYVRVETSQPTGTRSLFFFRHDDGYWCVFPPDSDRAKMHVERLAA
jgi:hypothetical protein